MHLQLSLIADAKSNSLKNSKKMFFNSLIYEDVLLQIEAKGFDKNFLKIYNNYIDIEMFYRWIVFHMKPFNHLI